jgi:hypothetical protein
MQFLMPAEPRVPHRSCTAREARAPCSVHLGGLQAIAHRQRSAGKDRPGRPACVIDGLEIIILFI